MDIVIPIQKQTTELKFAIRSLEKYIPHNKIYLFDKGDKPGLQHKEANIFNKIMQAVNDDRVSDDFIFANDDHFILPGFDVSKYYYNEWSVIFNGIYSKTIQNTHGELFAYLRDLKYFDIHCPIIYNKQKFINTVALLDWTRLYGYCIKTVYCNLNEVEGTYYKDLKLQNPILRSTILNLIKDRIFFSTSVPVNKQMIAVLEELYQVNYEPAGSLSQTQSPLLHT